MTNSKTIWVKNLTTGKYIETTKNSSKHLKLLDSGFVPALVLNKTNKS